MTIVAYSHPFVVGVDTHARNHVFATIAAASGQLLETRNFPTTASGINRAIAWVARRTDADLTTLWGWSREQLPMALCSQARSRGPATRSPKPRAWISFPAVGWESLIGWTHTGLRRQCSLWRSISCAARG